MAKELKKVKGMNSQLRENRLFNSQQRSRQAGQNINTSPTRLSKKRAGQTPKNGNINGGSRSPREVQDQQVIAASAPDLKVQVVEVAEERNLENVDGIDTPNLSSLEQNGNIINVHQHFNQPNIMNFNHNEYFDKFNKLAKNGQNGNVTNLAASDKKIDSKPDADPKNEIDLTSGNKPKRAPSENVLQGDIPRVQSNKNISEIRKFKRGASAAKRSTNELVAKRYGQGRVATAKPGRSPNIGNSFQNRPQSRDGSRSSVGMNSNSLVTRSFLNGAINPNQQVLRPNSRNQKSSTGINVQRSRKNWMHTAQDPGQIQPAFTQSGQISQADERKAFRNMRNMSAHRLESGQAFSGLDYANGEVYLNDGYFYPNDGQSKKESVTNIVSHEEMSSLFSGQTHQLGQNWAQKPQAFRQSQNNEYYGLIRAKDHKNSKGRLQSANPFMSAKSRQNNANMLIYTPGSGKPQRVGPLQKGSGSQVNIAAQTGQIMDSGDVQTTGAASSLALRLSPSAILRIGQSSHKRLMDMSHQLPKKSKANQDFLKREDIYDSLITLKTELNRVSAENTKVKTKLAIQQDHLKNKDKFIDELLKSTYVMSQAIGMGGLGNLKQSLAQTRASTKNAIRRAQKSPRDESNQRFLDPEQKKMSSELNSSAQNYFTQNFLEKGPYNLLRMKKQVNDMKELIQHKNEEIGELHKNMRITKCVELTEEIQIYQEECIKLRKVAEQSINILAQHGLSSLLDKKKMLKNFKKTLNMGQMYQDNGQLGDDRSSSPLVKTGYQPNDQLVQQLMEHNNHLQREYAGLTQRYEEQCQLTANALDENLKRVAGIQQLNFMNDGQSLKILDLTVLVDELRAENKATRDSIDKNLSVIRVKQDSDDVSLKAYKEDILKKDTEIKDLRQQIIDQSKQIQNIKQEFAERPAPEQDGNWVYEGQKIKTLLDEETCKKELLKEKITEQQATIKELNECLQNMENKLQELKNTVNQEKEKETPNKNSDLINQLDQAHEKLREERKDYLELQQTLKDVRQETQIQVIKINELQASLKAAKEALAIAEKKSSHASTTKVEDLRLTAMRLSDLYQSSKASNSQLREEAHRIRNILEGAEIEDVDERSEVISNLKSALKSQKSFVEGQSLLGSPVRREQRRQTNPKQKQSSVRAVEMIPEVREHEGVGDSSSRKNNQEKPNEDTLLEGSINVSAVYMDDPALKNINEQIAKEESKNQAGKPFLGAIGKSQSSGHMQGFQGQYGKAKKQKTQMRLDSETAAAANQFKFGKQKTQHGIEDEPAAASSSFGAQKSHFGAQQRLVDQLNRQIDTETVHDDALSHFVVPFPRNQAAPGLATEHLIDSDDASVQLALDMIAILQQIHRVPNDDIEGILFGDKSERHRLVKLADLSSLFQLKLNIQHEQAFKFARWLIEERPEEGESPTLPQYDPDQTIALGTVVVRLMVYSRYPRIYFDSHETTAKEQFTVAFRGRQAKFIRAVTAVAEQNQGALITSQQFTELVKSMSSEIGEQDLECAFVFLCRGGNAFEELKQQSDNVVCKYLLGFNSTVTFKIFNEIEDESTSRNASSDCAPLEANIQFGRAVTQTKINLHQAELENDDTQISPAATPVTPFLGGFPQNTANFVQPVTSTERKPERKPADNGVRRDSFAFTEMKSDSKDHSGDAPGSKESEIDAYTAQNHLANPEGKQRQRFQKQAFSFCMMPDQQQNSSIEGVVDGEHAQKVSLSAPPKLQPLQVGDGRDSDNQMLMQKQNTYATGGFQSVVESGLDVPGDRESNEGSRADDPENKGDPADDYSDSRSEDDWDLQRSLKKGAHPNFGVIQAAEQPPPKAVMDYNEAELAQIRGAVEQVADPMGMTMQSFVFSSQTDMSATMKQRGFSVTSSHAKETNPVPQGIHEPPRGSLANQDISKVPANSLGLFAAIADASSDNESPLSSPQNDPTAENKSQEYTEQNAEKPLGDQNQLEVTQYVDQDKKSSIQSAKLTKNTFDDVAVGQAISEENQIVNGQGQLVQAAVDNDTEDTPVDQTTDQAIYQNHGMKLVKMPSTQSERDDQEKRVQFKTTDSGEEPNPLSSQHQTYQSAREENIPIMSISDAVLSQNGTSTRNAKIPITSISSEAINIGSPTVSQAEQSQLLQVQAQQTQDQIRTRQQTPGFKNLDENEPQYFINQEQSRQHLHPFTEAQVENLTITLEQCLVGKIQEELRMGMNQESLQRVLDYSIDTLKRVAQKMLQLQCYSVRELLHEDILVVKDSQVNEQADQPEVEVLRPLDLIDRFEKVINEAVGVEEPGPPLDNTQKQCILIVLQNDLYGDLISYNEVCQAFKDLGVPEGKPPSTPQMNYTELSLKSIRIINRMAAFVQLNNIDFGEFMSDIVVKQAVKTKSSMHADIEIMMSKRFFAKLHQHGIKQSPEICHNLCEFLCIDKKYTKYLMLKKLKKCIADFQASKYYLSIGQRKNKPGLEEYEQIELRHPAEDQQQLQADGGSSLIQDNYNYNTSQNQPEGGEASLSSLRSLKQSLSQQVLDEIKSLKLRRNQPKISSHQLLASFGSTSNH